MVDGRDRALVQPPEHQHYFRRAEVRDAHGRVMPDGRRCACGVEVVGSPFGINAALVRAGQRFNDAMAEGARNIAAAMRAAQDRTRER